MNIISSLYLLDFVDSPLLRKNVQTALNRGESYHQLRRAVSYANFGKLRFKSEDDQHLWHECGRLVTNCIIYYNMAILSQLLPESGHRPPLSQPVEFSRLVLDFLSPTQSWS